MQPHEQAGQPAPPAGPRRSYRPSPAAFATLVAAVLGFVCTASSKTEIIADGERRCSYFDFAPLLLAAATALAAVLTLARAGRPPRQPAVEVSIGVLGLAVAAVHVLRAFGVLDSGC
jgi:hypothetical protein